MAESRLSSQDRLNVFVEPTGCNGGFFSLPALRQPYAADARERREPRRLVVRNLAVSLGGFVKIVAARSLVSIMLSHPVFTRAGGGTGIRGKAIPTEA